MATEEEKKRNLIKLYKLVLFAVEKGIYDTLGDGVSALIEIIGEELLEHKQKEMGFEVAGSDAKEILTELGRLFADEWGFVDGFDISGDEKMIALRINNCHGHNFCDELLKEGVSKPFACPVMCSGEAALNKAGIKAHPDDKREGDHCAVTFKILS